MILRKTTMKLSLVLIGLLLLTGWFYWFQWRPSEIRKECYIYATEEATKGNEGGDLLIYDYLSKKDVASKDGDYKSYFTECLMKNGLQVETSSKGSGEVNAEVSIPKQTKEPKLDQEQHIPSSGVSSNGDQTSLSERFEQKCQEEQTTYNSCLIKYNTEMLEYQNCQLGDKTFGCPLSSREPLNTCEVNISSWCRKQILGHY